MHQPHHTAPRPAAAAFVAPATPAAPAAPAATRAAAPARARAAAVAPRAAAALALLTLLAPAALAPAAPGDSWTATGTGDWHDPANWEGSQVPSPTQGAGINITNGGTAILSGTFAFTANTGPVISIGDGSGLASGLRITGDGRLESTPGIFLGRGAAGNGSTGILILDDNATLKADTISLGRSADSTGVLTLDDHAAAAIATDLILGFQANATGTLSLSGQSSLTARDLIIARDGTATGRVTIDDNAILQIRYLKIGSDGSNPMGGPATRGLGGSFIMTGGTLITDGAITNNGSRIGDGAGSSGTVRLSGSAVWIDSPVNVNAIQQTWIGSAGTGALILEGNAAYIGHHLTNSLQIGSLSTGTGVITVRGNATLSSAAGANSGIAMLHGTLNIEGNATVTLSRLSIASGAGQHGTVNLSGGVFETGYVELSRNATGTATLIMNGGTLRATQNDNFGPVDATGTNWLRSKVPANATIRIDAGGATIDTNAHAVSSAIPLQGAGPLAKTGEGILTLAAANTHTGPVAIAAGTLRYTDATLSLPASIHIAAGATLDTTLASATLNNLSGSGAVTGPSALTLRNTADTTYAGAAPAALASLAKTGPATLTLAAPRLDTAALALAEGRLALAGGTLAVATTAAVHASGTLAFAAPGAKLTAGALTFASGATIDILAAPASPLATLAETVTPLDSAVLSQINLHANGAPAASSITLDTYHTYALLLADSNRALQLATTLLWDSTGTAHGTFNIPAGATYAPSVSLADRSAASFTPLASWDGKTLDKTGAGTLDLAIPAAYTGATRVNTGTLRLTAPGALAASATITIAPGATLETTGLQTLQTLDNAGALTLASGTLALTGSLALAADSTLNLAAAPGAGPVLTAASVAIASTATLNVTSIAEDTQIPYTLIAATTGAIAGDFGTVSIGGVSGVTDYFTVATTKSPDAKKYLLSAALTWDQSGTDSHGTFTLDPGAAFTVATPLADKSPNAAKGWDGKTLVKQGAGTLILAAANTHTGATRIEDGLLQIGAAGVTGAITASPIHIAAGGTLAFDRADAHTHATPVTGPGALIHQGSGTLTLAADNPGHTGPVTVAAGQLRLGDGGAAGSLAGPIRIEAGAALAYDRSDALATGTLAGPGALIQQGSGTLILAPDAAAGRTGPTLIQNGLLLAATADALGAGPVTNHATLEIATPADASFANLLDGGGVLRKTGPATLAITGSNPAFAGLTRVETGTLALAAIDALGSSTIALAPGATLEYKNIAAHSPADMRNTVTGGGALLATTSTLVLSRPAALATATLRASTLTLGHAGALGGDTADIHADAGSAIFISTPDARLGRVTLDGGATLGFARAAGVHTPFAATVATLAAAGPGATLVFNADLARLAPGLNPAGTVADHLRVTGSLAGACDVIVSTAGTRPAARGVAIELITTPDPAGPGAFTLAAPASSGVDAYELRQGNGTDMLPDARSWYLADAGASDLARVIFNTGALPGLDWHHSLDTLHLRLGDLRALADTAGPAAPRPDAAAWARFRAHRLDATAAALPFEQDSRGLTFGLDRVFHHENARLLLGALADTGWIDSRFDDGSRGDTTSTALGLYAACLHDTGWYAAAAARLGRYKHNLDLLGDGRYDTAVYSADARDLSLELGRRFGRAGDGWWLETSLQAALARFAGGSYNVRASGIEFPVEVASSTAVQYRAQARLGRRLAASLHPHLKLALAGADTTGGEVRADTRAARVDFDGWRLEAGAGLTWRLTPRSHLHAACEYATAETYDRPWSLTLGYRHEW